MSLQDKLDVFVAGRPRHNALRSVIETMQDGTILYSEVNPDYTHRPEPEGMIPVLQMAAAVTV
jgi:peroxiredoxin